MRWAGVMRRLGGGSVTTPYPPDFFHWQRRQIMAIDDYSYIGIEFRIDPNMPIPLGAAYGDIGNNPEFIFIF